VNLQSTVDGLLGQGGEKNGICSLGFTNFVASSYCLKTKLHDEERSYEGNEQGGEGEIKRVSRSVKVEAMGYSDSEQGGKTGKGGEGGKGRGLRWVLWLIPPTLLRYLKKGTNPGGRKEESGNSASWAQGTGGKKRYRST